MQSFLRAIPFPRRHSLKAALLGGNSCQGGRVLRTVAGTHKRQGNRIFSLRGLGIIVPEKWERGVRVNGGEVCLARGHSS